MSSLDVDSHLAKLRTLAFRRGSVAVGVANLTQINTADFLLPAQTLSVFNRAVSLAMPLSPAVLATIAGQPNLLYEHHYRQVNFALDRLALELTNNLQATGFAALPIPASQLVDWDNQRGHLSHKRIAAAAGLGWIGRNNLLVVPSCGSRVRLVTVLTNAPLPVDSPATGSCDPCRACIAACPAKAIGESPAEFNHLACFTKLKEFQRQRLVSHYICGVCVQVCTGQTASARNGSPGQQSG